MNWDHINSNSKLIYASVPEDIGFRTWSLKKTIHKVQFYKVYPIEEIDRIVCGTLKSHHGSLDINKFAKILGFNVVDDYNASPKRYADKAEYELFQAIIKPVIDWGLAIRIEGMLKLTELGNKAYKEGKKYKFFTGTKVLFENPNLQSNELQYQIFFPFYNALGIFSDIQDRQQIEYEKINISEVFECEETNLIRQHSLQSKEPFFIFKSEPTIYFSFESCVVDIRLFQKGNDYYPIIFLNNQISLDATNLLNEPLNSEQKNKKVEWGLYLKLIKDPEAILDYNTIIPFEDLIELSSLIKDSRLVWSDNKLFLSIAENANANDWLLISNYCPIEILKSHIVKYKEKLDWTSLSLRIDDEFLKENATKFPWNYTTVSSNEGIGIEVIKELLLIRELKKQEWDWDKIMPQLDFKYIKSNIDKVDFELFEFTKTNKNDALGLVVQFPYKTWDWIYISDEYELSFILGNILVLKDYINFKKVINRAFASESYANLFCKSPNFLLAINEVKDSRLKDYSPNQAQYCWTEQLIEFLEKTGYLIWESGSYVLGFECNPYLDWTKEFFTKHHSKIVTQKGFDYISAIISDTRIITEHMDFNWNWQVISANSQLNKDSQFLLSVKEKIQIDTLLHEISGSVLDEIFESFNIFSFLDAHKELWKAVTEKISIDLVRKHIEYDWDWNVLTKRVHSSLKIESLGNSKWVDKWDWRYLTQNLDISIIIEKLDVFLDYWDWEYLTRRLDKEFVLNNLPEYNDYWDWEILLTDRIDKSDLLKHGHLGDIVACISVFDDNITEELWKIITRKFDYFDLENLINETIRNEMFHWDYSYFYDLPDFNPRQYLNTNLNYVSWKEFSNSKQLNNSFRWDKLLCSYEVWKKDVIKLLKNELFKWNFSSLSKLDSINWNDSILAIHSEKWDWHYLSEYSSCFKKEKDFLKRFIKFAKYIDYQVFSKRTDSDISDLLLAEFINKDWDWAILSANTSATISLSFIERNKEKNWDWQRLSIRNDIVFDNETFIQLLNQNWDWDGISFRTDFVYSEEFISKIYDKPLMWNVVSQIKSFVPNEKTLSLLKGYTLDWKAISENINLSAEILWDYRDRLMWNSVTRNIIIDLSNEQFLTKYQDYLDWDFISQSEKFPVSYKNLLKFKEKVTWEIINKRHDFSITLEMLDQFTEYLDWTVVSKSMTIQLTGDLIEKYRNKWDWQVLRTNPQIIEKLEDTLSIYKAEFNCVDFIEHFDKRPYIYHFTHLFNAVEIIKNRKIFSRSKAEGKFSNAAGSLVTRRGTAHDYTRFYFRPQTPTQFYNECLGWDAYLTTSYNKSYYSQARNLGLPKCPIPVFFKFDLKEVLQNIPNQCFYSTGNMQTDRARVIKIIDNPNSLQTKYLYDNISDTFYMAGGPYNYNRERHLSLIELVKEYSQQEFLISEEFDFSDFKSFEIICYNDEYVSLLKAQLGDDPICDKINDNGYGVFHRGNRELLIHETDTEITIISDYRDSAYLSLKGEGLKNIKVLNPEKIQKETINEIIAYPEIAFTKTEQPIEIHFIDLSYGTRDWLVYKN